MSERPTVTIKAERLLTLLKALRPIAGTDKERKHLMQLRFAADATHIQVNATDGRTMGQVAVGVESCTEPVIWCIATEHLPLIEQLLSRLDQKERAEATVDLTIGRIKVQVTLQQSQIFVPKSDDQLALPYEKVIPDAYIAGRDVAGQWALDPLLVKKVMAAAARVCWALEWSAPPDALKAIRLDIAENTPGYEGVFVIMPMDVHQEREQRAQEEAEKAAKAAGREHEPDDDRQEPLKDQAAE